MEHDYRRCGKTSVIIFGSLGVAVDCLEWLIDKPDYEVLGVVCSTQPMSPWRKAVSDRDMQDAARRLGVPILSMNDVLSLDADIGLSVRFNEILRKAHLNRFRLGVVNLHGAPLPGMRGSMGDAIAILEGSSTFGITLHWMDEGIDTGDILIVENFSINNEDTVYDLFVRCNQVGLAVIKQHLHYIVTGQLVGESQTEILKRTGGTTRSFTRKDVLKYKRIDNLTAPKQLWNVVRAFQFPGQEPPFFDTPHGRIYLTVEIKKKEQCVEE